jgi:hypothetical protein
LKPAKCPAAKALPPVRRAAAAARIREHRPDPLAWWRSVLATVNASPFLRGEKGDWVASFDWLLKPANLLKVEEGAYADGKAQARSPSTAVTEASVQFHRSNTGTIHDF